MASLPAPPPQLPLIPGTALRMTSIGLVVDCLTCGVAVTVTICQSDRNGNAGKPMARVSTSPYCCRYDIDLVTSMGLVVSSSGSRNCSTTQKFWPAYLVRLRVLSFLQRLPCLLRCPPSHRARGPGSGALIVYEICVGDPVHCNVLRANVRCTALRMVGAQFTQHRYSTKGPAVIRRPILSLSTPKASDTTIFTRPCRNHSWLMALRHHNPFLDVFRLSMTS